MMNLLGLCSDQLGTNHIRQTAAPKLVYRTKVELMFTSIISGLLQRNLLGLCSDQQGTNYISQTTEPQLVIADKS
jgi:hypothetical protein